MTFRGFLVAVLFALGLTGSLLLISFGIGRVVYGDSLAQGATVQLGGISLMLLAAAYLLARGSDLPFRLIAFYIVAFAGVRVAVLPVRHRELSEWHSVDYFLLLVGVSLFVGALLWSYSYQRARRLKSPAV